MVCLNDFNYTEQDLPLIEFLLGLAPLDTFWAKKFETHIKENDWNEEHCFWDFVQLIKPKDNQLSYGFHISCPNSVKHFQIIFLCYILAKPELYDSDKIAAVWKRYNQGIQQYMLPKERLEPLKWVLSRALFGLGTICEQDLIEYLTEFYRDFGFINSQEEKETLIKGWKECLYKIKDLSISSYIFLFELLLSNY